MGLLILDKGDDRENMGPERQLDRGPERTDQEGQRPELLRHGDQHQTKALTGQNRPRASEGLRSRLRAAGQRWVLGLTPGRLASLESHQALSQNLQLLGVHRNA